MKPCGDIVPLLGPLYDGALADDDRAFALDHLRGCASCRDRLALIGAQAQALREALSARAAAIDLEGFTDRVMEKVRDERGRTGERARVLGRELWWAHKRAFTAAGGLALAACMALAVFLSPSPGDELMLADNSPQVEEVDFGTRGGAVLQLTPQTTVIWMSDDRAVQQ